MEPKEAVALAVSRVGESISASAGTVILALLSLLFATFGIYHDLGIPLAVGIATMLLAGVTLLPALLAILGRAVFWPSTTAGGPGASGAVGARSRAPSSQSRFPRSSPASSSSVCSLSGSPSTHLQVSAAR